MYPSLGCRPARPARDKLQGSKAGEGSVRGTRRWIKLRGIKGRRGTNVRAVRDPGRRGTNCIGPTRRRDWRSLLSRRSAASPRCAPLPAQGGLASSVLGPSGGTFPGVRSEVAECVALGSGLGAAGRVVRGGGAFPDAICWATDLVRPAGILK